MFSLQTLLNNKYLNIPVKNQFTRIDQCVNKFRNIVVYKKKNEISKKQILLEMLKLYVVDQPVIKNMEYAFFKTHQFKIYNTKPWRVKISVKFLKSMEAHQYQKILMIAGHIGCLSSGQFNRFSNYSSSYTHFKVDPSLLMIYNTANMHMTLASQMFTQFNYQFRWLVFTIGVQKTPPIDNQITYKGYLKIQEINSSQNPQVKYILKQIQNNSNLDIPRSRLDAKLQKINFKCPFLLPPACQKCKVMVQSTMLPPKFIPYNQEQDPYNKKKSKDKDKVIRNNYLIKRFERNLSNFQNAQKFVELIQKIPNFKVKLTQEQSSVIGTNGNIVLIGRSGTGKTTTSVLRLFSLEIVFKIRKQFQKFKLLKQRKPEQKQNLKIGVQHLEESTGLHCIFATASPVLTNEIYRYYKNLTSDIKAQIRKKEQARNQKFKQMNEHEKSEEKLLEEEFQDIKLDKKISIEDKDQIQDSEENVVEKYTSLMDIKDSDFPVFLTIKGLILMVDSCLVKPFFYRSIITKDIKQNMAEWHNEQKGIMMIQDYYKKFDNKFQEGEEDFEETYEEEPIIQPKQSFKKLKNTRRDDKKITFEIQYEYFENYFWELIKSKFYYSKIKAHLVWTEIYSTIKGSINSGLAGLRRQDYFRQCTNTNLTYQQKQQIYKCYRMYQKWKTALGAYDFMDVVNYVLHQLNHTRYLGPDIHYIMIDEVQDLTYATIKLITALAKFNVFFSGDTAQAIAKGVGFRFGQMSTIFKDNDFSEKQLQKPAVMQLTTNFRSHNNILELANSVISIIQIIFPQTIDILKKQKSPVSGPKPLLNSSADNDFFLSYFLGGEKISEGLNKLQFGCNQVVIVRNQESKQNLPTYLQHALCLTIYQCKGLQFNDVILFNFFTESTAKWSLLHDLDIDKKNSDEQNLSKLIVTNQKNLKNSSLYFSELCSELKLLYVAITRPKQSLIIYDKDTYKRSYLEKLWVKANLVNVFDKKPNTSNYLFLEKSQPEEWEKQGIKMFKKKFYEQAQICYKFSGNKIMQKTCRAYILADNATKQTIKIKELEQKANRQSIEWNLGGSKPIPKKQLKAKKVNINLLFKQAAHTFESVNMIKQAAKCYFSAKQYQKARDLFQQIKMDLETAQCYFILGEYKQALQYYKLAKNYLKQIQCLDFLEEWEQILLFMNENREVFLDEQRNLIVTKYSNLAYKSLLKTMQQDQVQIPTQQQIKQKKQTNANLIQEQGQQSNSDSDNQFLDRKRNANIVIQQQIIEEIEQKERKENQKELALKEKEKEKEEEIIQEIKKVDDSSMAEEIVQVDKKKLDDSESFANLNQDDSFAKFNEQSSSFADLNQPDFDNLKSLVDPEDQWIGKSLSQIKKDTFSQYSIIQDQKVIKASLIKTKGNIYVQDDVMRRLIKITQAGSFQLKSYLNSRKSKQALLTNKNTVATNENEKNDLLQQFQMIEPEIINLVLDSLESQGYYKLCIFVCNRYNMPQKLGRYLVSIASDYSILSKESLRVMKALLIPHENRKRLIQKAILGSIAIHNAFEIINPEFFNLKQNYENYLGKYCVNGLIYLGMYKKAVFMLNTKSCLQILYTFSDINTYAEVYLSKIRKMTEKFEINEKYPAIFYCQNEPKDLQEQEFSLFAYQKFLDNLLLFDHNHQIFTIPFIRQQNKTTTYINLIPKYFPMQKKYWQYKSKIDYFITFLHSEKKQLKTISSKVTLFDTVVTSLLALIAVTVKQKKEFQDKINKHCTYENINKFIETIKIYVNYIKILKKKVKTKQESLIFKYILVLYGAKIPQSPYISYLEGCTVIERGRNILHKLLDSKAEEEQSSCLYFIDQNLNLIAANYAQTVQIVIQRISQSLQNLIFQISWIFEAVYREQNYRRDFIENSTIALFLIHLKHRILSKKLKALQQKVREKRNFKKPGSTTLFTRSMITDVFYYTQEDYAQYLQQDEEEIQIVEDQNSNTPCVFFQLPNLHRDIQEGILKFYYYHQLHKNIKGNCLLLSKIGLNKLFGQIQRKQKKNDDYFQAMEFRRFHRLDEYLYHLNYGIELESEINQMRLCEQVIMLISVRILANIKKQKTFTLTIPNFLVKYLESDRNQQGLVYLFSSESENRQLGKELKKYLDYYQTLNRSEIQTKLIIICIYLIQNHSNIELWENFLISQMKYASKYAITIQMKNLLNQLQKKRDILNIKNLLLQSKTWNFPLNFDILSITIKSNHNHNLSLSQKDYDKYQIDLYKRITATRIITKAIKKYLKQKNLKNVKNQKNYSDYINLKNELIKKYYITPNLDSLDIHLLLDLTNKISNNRDQQTIDSIKKEFEFWQNAQSQKFMTKELEKKKIYEIKWITRNKIKPKKNPVKKN